MADAPVGGRVTGTGTGDAAAPAEDDAQTTRPDRIPVTEVPDPEPEEDEEAREEDGDEAGEEPAQDAETDEPEAGAGAGPAPAEAVEKPAGKPAAKSTFDVFAAKPAAKPAPEVEPDAADDEAAGDAGDGRDFDAEQTTALAKPAAAAAAEGAGRVPVIEVPDVEPDEPDDEDAGDGRDFDAEQTTALAKPAAAAAEEAGRVPVAEVPDVEADEADADPAAATMLVPSQRPGDAEETEQPPPPHAAEADETTLIPKVTPEKATESTTVMPSVPPSPRSDMSRRPYTPAPSGYGSARQEWNRDVPDAQPTRVQPRVPGQGGGSAGRKSARGYQPPEFHKVDPNRAELPPPQNFKLDRRELDEEQEPGRHIGRRALLVGGLAAVVAAGGLAATGKIKLPGTTPTAPPTVGFAPATASGASPATQTGTAFLTAWQNNQLQAAANITDDPAAALAALEAYRKNLGVVGMVMNPNAANGVGWMTFGITTQGGAPMGQWQYESSLGTYSKEIDGFARWFVKWDPSILYASLKQGYELKIQKTPASVKGLVDRNGTLIDPTAHPSLAGIVSDLTKKAVATGATDGQDIIMVDAKGNQLATVTTLTPPIDNGTVKTTFDMKIQTAMEKAVNYRTGGMVAIEPSTGHILGIANDSSEYYDVALLAGRAPGSTFKIITSTALLHNNLTTIDTNVVCPGQLNVEGTVLNNSEGESAYGSTYEEDFAASCNNAFSSFWNQGVTPNMLADTAKTFYGLNQQWDLGSGESAQYMVVPGDLTGALLAESLVGQGNILSCPLAMCSVAATVANGSFKQPIMIPGAQQIPATPLGSKLQSDLKALMASVVSEGTAAGVFPNNGHFFAKTGTAETGPRSDVKNDSWFVVFHDQADIALGALGVDGGYGAALAAPQCAAVFKSLGYM
jgi:hypothetical protein